VPAPIPAPRLSGYTRTTAIPLYYAVWGPAGAPRLIVLHGGPGAHHDYLLPQMLHLAGSHEVVFYDQRGGGRSRTDAREPITWQTHVEDLGRVVAELDGGAPSLVGYSWGGLLALLYAIAATRAPVAPPAPRRLVLIDPAPVSGQYRRAFESEFARRQQGAAVQEMREALTASGLKDTDPDAWRQRMFEIGVAGYFADPRRARDLTPFRVTGRVQQSVWESLGDYDLRADLATVRCPALVVHGRQDPIPAASSGEIAARLGATLVMLDECGHVPYVEQPAALFAAVDRFLADTADAPAPPPADAASFAR
jgi:proline iminopeptidase